MIKKYDRRKWIGTSLAAIPGFALLDIIQTNEISSDDYFSNNEKYWLQIKQQFPLQKGLYYFNNASLGPSPNYVLKETNKFRTKLESFPSFYMWEDWKEEKEMVRTKMAKLVNADQEEIALTHNTTEGFNIIASSLLLKPGEEVILLDQEHPSSVIPWKHWQEKKGIKLVQPKLPNSFNEKIILALFKKLITPKTKAISVSHISYTLGTKMPLRSIAKLARQYGILMIVDGAQALGQVEINLKDIDCDFYAASCHKWLFSPKGMGVLYAKKDKQHLLKPLIVTGGYEDKSIRRLENYNTRNLVELLGTGSAIDFHNNIGAKKIEQRTLQLCAYFKKQIALLKKIDLKSPADQSLSSGIVTISINGKSTETVKKQLAAQFKIACRTINSHNIKGLRFSFSIYNTKKEIDYLIKSLKKIV